MGFTACSTSTCSSKRDKAEGSSLTKRLIQGTTFITDRRTLYLLARAAIIGIDREESLYGRVGVYPLLSAEIKQRNGQVGERQRK